MKSRPWEDDEVQRALGLLKAGWEPVEIGQTIGRSEAAVRGKFIALGLSSARVPSGEAEELRPTVVVAEPTLEEAIAYVERRDERMAARQLRQKAVQQVLEDRLIETFQGCIAESFVSIQVEPPLLDRPFAEPCSAVLVLSDLHVGKVVDPRETEHGAKYDPAVFLARLHRLEEEVLHLVSQGPAIEELIVFLLGDIVEGALDHHNEREETLLVSQQFALATRVLAQCLGRLSVLAPQVRVCGVPGNHGRWPGQKRMPTVGRSSNLDTLVYLALEMITEKAGLSHVSWELRDASRQLVRIQETLVQIVHGDELRGGEFCVGGLRKEVFNSVLRGAETGKVPDLWVLGDKHVSVNLPMGAGNVLINGSLVGEDVFGQRFAPTVPSQTLFWIGRDRGRFLQSEIRLDAARLPDPLPYDLPAPLRTLVASYL
jgi:hypothetical protein